MAEAMIQATTAGASEEERAAAALADRYAVSVARSRGAREETIPLLRMIVAVMAADRIEQPRSGPDRETAVTLVDGLWQRRRESSPEETELADQLAAGVVALAWLQRPNGLGERVDPQEALDLLAEHAPELDPRLCAELGELARNGALEERREEQAA